MTPHHFKIGELVRLINKDWAHYLQVGKVIYTTSTEITLNFLGNDELFKYAPEWLEPYPSITSSITPKREFIIRGDTPPKNSPLEFWLEKLNDDIILRCRTADTSSYYNILSISQNGLYLYAGIPDSMSIKLDKDGRVVGR